MCIRDRVTRQILNQSLSQVKVHLKANYNMYIKEETNEDRKKREEEEAEIDCPAVVESPPALPKGPGFC